MKSEKSEEKRDLPEYTRGQLQRGVEAVIGRKGLLWRPTVYVARLEERLVVWKDMGGALWPFCLFLRPLLRREARALAALAGMPSVPQCLGMVGRDGFLMEKLEAERLPHLDETGLDLAFFDALLAELRAMHARGVSHGDLRRKNILVETATRHPKLIDFGTAVLLGPTPGPLRLAWWRRACRIDLLHYAKLKEHYLPGALTEDETRWLHDTPWYYRLGRLLRGRIYRPLKWRNLRKSARKMQRRWRKRRRR